MKEYSFFESDYKDHIFENQSSLIGHVDKNILDLRTRTQKDPFLSQLTEAQKETLISFIADCNFIAANAKGEISISIHPDTSDADAVIIVKEIHLHFPMNKLFSNLNTVCDRFHAEPIDENDPRLMLYFNHPLKMDNFFTEKK